MAVNSGSQIKDNLSSSDLVVSGGNGIQCQDANKSAKINVLGHLRGNAP